MINLCIPTLCRYDLLAQCISSALEGSLRPTQINIIDNGGKFRDHFGDIKEIDGVPLDLFVPKKNIGVTSSFNHFAHKYDDYTIVCNDDIKFHNKTIELMVKAAQDNPNEIFFTGDGYWEHAFSLFLQKKDMLSLIGEYDPNFENYFSDRDMIYRMSLRGYKPFIVKRATYEHVDGGSQTVRSGEPETKSVSERFNLSGKYYEMKWAGICGMEQVDKAFGIL